MGFCLVLVFVGGLCVVAYAATVEARYEAAAQYTQAARFRVELLSTQLAGAEAGDAGAYQRVLRQFSVHADRCEQLRVVDTSGNVVASLRSEEIGHPVRTDDPWRREPPRHVEIHPLPSTESGDARRLFRSPIGGPGTASHFLEGVVVWPRPGLDVILIHSWTPAVILVCVGLLFLLYRRLQAHFRGVSRIAENLTGPWRDRLAEAGRGGLAEGAGLERELTTLRVSEELGAVAASWNQLIDLAEELRTQTLRSTAWCELKTVLERSAGGDLAHALNGIRDGILVLRSDTRIVYANTTMIRMLVLGDGDDVSNRPVSQLALSPLGNQIVRVIESARAPGGTFRSGSETVHVDSEESSYRVQVSSAFGEHQRGTGIVWVTDISQQLRAEKAREEFVSQVTHELRTPLTNIRAYAETLSSGMFDDPKVIADCYNVITVETRRLSRLIEDILSVSQLEVGTMQMVMDDVDLHRLLTELVRDLRGLADEKSISLQLTTPAKLPVIQGDRDKLTVVLNNLIGNALKYTPEKGEVTVSCRTVDDAVSVTVKDNGIGIDRSEHERIFERFQRGRDPEVQKVTGTGIGLTTAREIVRRHGGEIEVLSEKGQGATFIVRIPCRPSRGEGVAAVGAAKTST
jgi:signal transduction histidine kinase